MKPKSVTIVEDHRPTARTIASTLNDSGRFRVSKILHDVDNRSKELAASPTDVLLLDVELQFDKTAGADRLKKLRSVLPETTKIVMLSVVENTDVIFNCLRDGAAGFLIKDDALSKIAEFLDEILEGRLTISATVARRIRLFFASLPNSVRIEGGLSGRQHQVIELISKGLEDADIAKALEIRPSTVKAHAGLAIEKLHAANRPHAVRQYLESST